MTRDGEKSFLRLFGLLEQIADRQDGMRARDLAEKSGIPLSTVFRMLKFLNSRGYIRVRDGVYTLGLGLARLGNIAALQNPLLKIARPQLAALAAQTLETVHLAELHGGRVRYVDKVEGVRQVRMASLIGNLSPAHCTGVGKALLAFLPPSELEDLRWQLDLTRYTPRTIVDWPMLLAELGAIRKRRYAIDDCEHEYGVYCVAAPILNRNGRAVAGLSVSGAELYLRSRTVELGNMLVAAAGRIAAELGE